jgi:hypothetical protein
LRFRHARPFEFPQPGIDVRQVEGSGLKGAGPPGLSCLHCDAIGIVRLAGEEKGAQTIPIVATKYDAVVHFIVALESDEGG